MSKRKTPETKQPQQPAVDQPAMPGGDDSDTLGKAPHTAPDGATAGQVEREHPLSERSPSDRGRGSDANVNPPGRGTSAGVESESDEDSRSRRRDLGP
jgi:hypothetical protein